MPMLSDGRWRQMVWHRPDVGSLLLGARVPDLMPVVGFKGRSRERVRMRVKDLGEEEKEILGLYAITGYCRP
ncbi:hypothetical protein PanWU01x14_081340 [Parasponia andersonii]|uniref:Uncharacterized protein n=1 Tax=Parasponia andersonii TaxID=3476 RepID=A0A2P5DAZ4_PARAD|nr:hypothetical protein PanWU01x14_081340 [Parasponia andersonii]